MITTATITHVDDQPRPSGLWVITASDGTRFATGSDFMASLAKRYCELGTTVQLDHGSGWYYKSLNEIRPVVTVKTEAVSWGSKNL